MADDSGTASGRNWTREAVWVVRPGRVRRYQRYDGGRLTLAEGSERDAPWGESAYVLWSEGDHTGVRPADSGELDAEALAERLAPDLDGLPASTPLVLAVPFAGSGYLDLLRTLASRLGRRVWAPSREGGLVQDPDTGEHYPAVIDTDPALPYGDWVPFDPVDDPEPFRDREWTALDGTRFRDSDVYTQPLVSGDGRRLGRISIADDDRLRGKEEGFRHYPEQDTVMHTVQVGDRLRISRVELVDRPDPMVYHFAAHGFPGRLGLVARGRTLWLSAEDGGRYIGGLRELAELPPEYTGMLTVCWSATPAPRDQEPFAAGPPPHADDPLADVPLPQHAANASGRIFTAPTGPRGFVLGDVAMTSPRHGEEGRMVTFRPEPQGEDLDALARIAGLDAAAGTSPGEIRGVALRLVRALRMAFGTEIEEAPGQAYQRALQGAGALERLRANDPALGRFTPFRWDMWTFLARKYTDQAVPDKAAYAKVLGDAWQRIRQEPDARLGAALEDPYLRVALAGMSGGQDTARMVLGLSSGAPVRDQDMARVLWAGAQAARTLGDIPPEQRETFGRAVLHLADTDRWDVRQWRALAVLAAAAHAEGLDAGDRDVLGALHLKRSGAYATAVLLGRDGEIQGVNWSGRPAPGGVRTDRVHLTGADGTASSAVAPWWEPAAPVDPHIVWTGTDPAGRPVLRLPLLGAVPVRPREFLTLLELSPALRDLRLGVPLVFLVSGLGAPQRRLPQAYSDRTGRPAWSYGGTVDLVADDPSGPLEIHLRPEPGAGTPGAWRVTGRRPESKPGDEADREDTP